MKKLQYRIIPIIVLSVILAASTATTQDIYYPGRPGDWQEIKPEDVGMDPGLLELAVQFAKANENNGIVAVIVS